MRRALRGPSFRMERSGMRNLLQPFEIHANFLVLFYKINSFCIFAKCFSDGKCCSSVGMEAAGQAFKSIFDKLSGFFDILDLSFFVSGAAFTLSILFWLHQREWYTFQDFQEMQFKGIMIVYVLVCYIAGMVVFALGRWFRVGVWEKIQSKCSKKENRIHSFDQYFKKIIDAHGLENHPVITEYLEKKGAWRLYIRLWAVVRENKKYAKSFSVINSFWVKAATYDGLSIFTLVAILMVADFGFGIAGEKLITQGWAVCPVIVFAIFAFFACIREAGRYVDHQMEELVATIAAGESNVLPNNE